MRQEGHENRAGLPVSNRVYIDATAGGTVTPGMLLKATGNPFTVSQAGDGEAVFGVCCSSGGSGDRVRVLVQGRTVLTATGSASWAAHRRVCAAASNEVDQGSGGDPWFATLVGTDGTSAEVDLCADGITSLARGIISDDRSTIFRVPSSYDTRPPLGVVQYERVFRCILPPTGAMTLTSGVGYWCFVGRVTLACTPKFIELQSRGAGAGAQTAELGLFSTPTAPSKAAQSLTKIEATGTVDALTAASGTIIRNTNAFSTLVAAGTYLWAGIRTAMATTQPAFQAHICDFREGHLLSLAASGALTGAGPFAGGIVAVNTSGEVPAMSVTLD